jgi:hypothetical protein
MSQRTTIKGLPISFRGESVEVLTRTSVQDRVGGPNDSAEIEEGFFIDAVILEKLRVIAKILEKPVQLPKCSLRTVEPAKKRVSFETFGFLNSELEFHKRLLWMPPVPCSLHADKEQTFEIAFGSALIQMKLRNLSLHDFTSMGCE